MLKKGLVMLLILAMAFSLFACKAQSEESTTGTTAASSDTTGTTGTTGAGSAEKLKIGLSWFSMSEEYLAKIYKEIETYVKENGMDQQVELVLLDAGMDTAKQNAQVDNLIAQKVDAIVMIPFDREGLVPAVEAAKTAGIPMIELCASTAATETRTSYVGSEDIASGRILMEELARVTGGKGKIVMIHGPAGQNAEIMRHTGAQEVLKKYPDMKVVADKICEWDRAKAMSAMENILQSNIDFDVVFSEDDGMAMGVLEAIAGSGRTDIVVGGIDGIPDALNAIKEGRLTCTVYQNAKAQGIKALEVAMKAAKGEKVDPVYDIPYELITKDNLANYME